MDIAAAGVALQIIGAFAVACDLLTGSLVAPELALMAAPVTANSVGDLSTAASISLAPLRECVGAVSETSASDDVASGAESAARYLVGLRAIVLPARLPSAGSRVAGPPRDVGGSLVVALCVLCGHGLLTAALGSVIVVKRRALDPTMKRGHDLLAPGQLFVAAAALLFPSFSMRVARWLWTGVAVASLGVLFSMKKGGDGSHLFVGIVGAGACAAFVAWQLYMAHARLRHLAAYHGYHGADVQPQTIDDVLLQLPGASPPRNAADPAAGSTRDDRRFARFLTRHGDGGDVDEKPSIRSRSTSPTTSTGGGSEARDDVTCECTALKDRCSNMMQPTGRWETLRHTAGRTLHCGAVFEAFHAFEPTAFGVRGGDAAARSTGRHVVWWLAGFSMRTVIVGMAFGSPFLSCRVRFGVATVAHLIACVAVALQRPFRYPIENAAAFCLTACNAFATLAPAAESGVSVDITIIVTCTIVGVFCFLRVTAFCLELLRWGPHEKRLRDARSRVVAARSLAEATNFAADWLRRTGQRASDDDDDPNNATGSPPPNSLRQRRGYEPPAQTQSPHQSGNREQPMLHVTGGQTPPIGRTPSISPLSEDAADATHDVIRVSPAEFKPQASLYARSGGDNGVHVTIRMVPELPDDSPVFSLWAPANPLTTGTRVGRQPRTVHSSSPYEVLRQDPPAGGARFPPPRRHFVCYDGDDHKWVDDDEGDRAIAEAGFYPRGGRVEAHFVRNSTVMETLLDNAGAPIPMNEFYANPSLFTAPDRDEL